MTDVTSEITVPILGQAGEPCRECGAPLAEDQRYCLGCGARRGAPRVELGRAAPPPAPAPPEPRRRRRADGATAIAGVATLLLAMGVGVLIGRAGRTDTTRASAPAQVISVSSGGAPSGAATTTTGGETSSPATARRHHKAKHAKARHASGSSGVKGGSKASNPTVQKLSKLSPKEYQKQSQKLPKTVGTGGKPPPKDNKKPAGGGGFEEIG